MPRKSPAKRSRTASRHRSVQRQVERADKNRPRREATKAMQAGARVYPEPPLPRQHQKKPGI